MTAGSIEGGGDYLLGSKQLTVGGNNLSTTVSGSIQDGGGGGGTGGSLVKVGAGMLTLSGVNTYIGGTTISAGTLAISATAVWAPVGRSPSMAARCSFSAFSTSRAMTLAAGGGTIDTNGNTMMLRARSRAPAA